MRSIGALLVLFAGAAAGQGRPTLVDCPLNVKTEVSDAVIADLQDDLRQQLARNPGVLVPTRSSWMAAVAALKRNDCEVRDECLQQLAVSAGVLYAMSLSLELNGAGDVTATGRVVSQDGVVVRPPESVQIAKLATFQDGARTALTLLLGKLKLDTLSPVPARAPVEASEGKETIVAVQPTPSRGLRRGSFVTGALAIASAAVAAGFGISAMTARGTLPANGHFTSEAQARAQASVNQGATIALGAGLGAGVLGAASIALFVLSSPASVPTPAAAPAPSVSLAPTPGGATLVLSGRF
jgi:hypothetical protein